MGSLGVVTRFSNVAIHSKELPNFSLRAPGNWRSVGMCALQGRNDVKSRSNVSFGRHAPPNPRTLDTQFLSVYDAHRGLSRIQIRAHEPSTPY